jgi:hypothetical protein
MDSSVKADIFITANIVIDTNNNLSEFVRCGEIAQTKVREKE